MTNGINRFALTAAESELFLECCKRFVQFVDVQAIMMIMGVSEEIAASIDVEGNSVDIMDCIKTNIRILPADLSTTLRAIDMARQQMKVLLAKSS